MLVALLGCEGKYVVASSYISKKMHISLGNSLRPKWPLRAKVYHIDNLGPLPVVASFRISSVPHFAGLHLRQ